MAKLRQRLSSGSAGARHSKASPYWSCCYSMLDQGMRLFCILLVCISYNIPQPVKKNSVGFMVGRQVEGIPIQILQNRELWSRWVGIDVDGYSRGSA